MCVAGATGSVCDCADGYLAVGETCKDVDECASKSSPCTGKAVCKNTVGSYECTCPMGLTDVLGDGTQCDVADKDDCARKPCLNGSKCLDGANAFTCDCTGTGFAGTLCDMNADDCSPNPCRNGGTCTDSVSGYMCKCKEGWAGEQCQLNVDECQAMKPCGENQDCRDTPGSFECACRKVSGCEAEGPVCSLGARKYDCTKDADGCFVKGATEACDAGTECQQATCAAKTGCGLAPKRAGEICGTDGTCDGKGECVVTKCGDRVVTGKEQCDPLAPGSSKWTCHPVECIKISNAPAFKGCTNTADCPGGYSCNIQKVMQPGTCLPASCSTIKNAWDVTVVQLGEGCAIRCSTSADCPPSAPDCGGSALDISENPVKSCRI
ncbi:MAG: hypothetical protein RLZZ450_3295 [Pseudomonadota bacterium]